MFNWFGVFLTIILMISGCSKVSATPSTSVTTSGIEGQVTVGPTCPGPVPAEGNTQCADKPFQATIQVLDEKNQLVTQFQTDAAGHFKLSLSPGTYSLHPISENMLPRAADQAVVVNPDKYTQVTVMYDTGMR